MIKTAIYGAGGLGKEVLTIIEAINHYKPTYDFIGFFDDDIECTDAVGKLEDLNAFKERLEVVVAIGNPSTKCKMVSSIKNPRISYANLIHPSVIVGDRDRVELANGVVIGAGTILTLDIKLSDHVLINLNCTIGHDVKIGTYSSIMPGVNIAGNVQIEDKCLIGSGSNIINDARICSGAIVGSGAVVTTDVDAYSTVVGVPAKPLKKSQ